MGMTPLEGLIMNTRSGNLDPGIILHLLRMGLNVEELEDLLYRKSGIKGLTGGKEIKDLGEEDLAFKLYVYRIKKYIGAYFAILPNLELIVFSGGVGEKNPKVRESVCKGLEHVGIIIDEEKNKRAVSPSFVEKEVSKVKILVLETDEELEIFQKVIK